MEIRTGEAFFIMLVKCQKTDHSDLQKTDHSDHVDLYVSQVH